MSTRDSPLSALLDEIRLCRACAAHLPHGPRPVLRADAAARILIVGQAPGTKVHASGIPWDDPSGDRLRDWMGVDKETFYNEKNIAIVPMGFCYPGKGASGDLPPRPECAPLWRAKLHGLLPDIRLTLLVGQYAQAYYLGERCKENLTATVAAWREHLPEYIVTPHPSPRNRFWLAKNPWFAAELVPYMRERVREALSEV